MSYWDGKGGRSLMNTQTGGRMESSEMLSRSKQIRQTVVVGILGVRGWVIPLAELRRHPRRARAGKITIHTAIILGRFERGGPAVSVLAINKVLTC